MGDKRLYEIALTKILGVGSKRGKQLVAYAGGVEAIFQETKSSLLKIPGIDEKTALSILQADPETLVGQDLAYLQKHNVKTTFYLDNDYPQRLRQIDDAPLLLYTKGTFDPHPARTVAIVGTRKPTSYGREICEQIIRDLQPFNIQLISGLAYGIDACAHNIASELNIENLAVMGTGIDQLYPSAHKSLALRILSHGALVSEYPIDTRPDRENFPRRNRVIAAMADIIIVVQSAAKGGSLITAELGNQYFKDVFAFPGRIHDAEFAGCNALIKQHKAHLLTSAADIAYIMRWEEKVTKKAIQPELFEVFSPEEEQILACIRTNDGATIDTIHATCKMNMSQVSSLLLTLEFRGVIRALPGKRYELLNTK